MSGRDAADDDPDLAVAGRPEIGDAMFHVTPYAAVERRSLRGDVGHHERLAALFVTIARDDGVVRHHVAAVVAALRVVAGRGSGRQ